MDKNHYSADLNPNLPLSSSVQRVYDSFPADKPVSSFEIVQRMLEIHPEFGHDIGGKIAGELSELAQAADQRQNVSRWLYDVSELFNADLVHELHGRLLILGLNNLDTTFAKSMKPFGLIEAVKGELKEPFESLLRSDDRKSAQKKDKDSKISLSTPSGESLEAQTESFIAFLNNRDKSRTQGFVTLVHGAADLEPLEDACFQQTWNKCLTARYRLSGNDALASLLAAFADDLRSIGEGGRASRGIIRPDVDSFKSLAAGPVGSVANSWGDPDAKHPQSELLEKLMQALADPSVLGVGQRLVLFGEVHGLSKGATLEDLGFSTTVLQILKSQPERLGIVLSGVPDLISPPEIEPFFQILSIPVSELETHGQAFTNDIPGGPDRLEILDEVNALAETIALEDMEPPLVVGILGGWGWGKSFVLHLIEERLRDIRSEPIQKAAGNPDEKNREFPYIGHPYVILFDAWTYAKSSLWASLMQTILLELNRQIGLEQSIKAILNEREPEEENPSAQDVNADEPAIWRMLSELDDRQLTALQDSDLGKKAIRASLKFKDGEATAGKLWTRFEALRDKEREKLQESESSLAQRRHELETARLLLEKEVDQKLEALARRRAWDPMKRELLALMGRSLAQRLEKKGYSDDPPSMEALKDLIRLPEKLKIGLNRHSLAFAGFAALSGLAPFLLELKAMQDVMAGIAAVMAALGGWLQTLRNVQQWLEKKHSSYQSLMQDVRDRLEEQREPLRREALSEQMKAYCSEKEDASKRTPEAPEETDEAPTATPQNGASPQGQIEAPTNIPRLEENIRTLEAEVEEHRRNVGITAGYKSLLDFVKGRLDSGKYDEELGFMNQVQKDFQDLTDALLTRRKGDDDLFPRGKPRIVLFIDDLDRCPPQRVVEVLEAAQLLVKTRLFVIVLAIDVRYVTRALEKEYRHVLIRNGEPSGLDYIEKIIQVPYRVRPIQPNVMIDYLRPQMNVAIQEPEAEEAVEITPSAEAETVQPTVEEISKDDAPRAEPAPEQTAPPAEITSPPASRPIQKVPTRIVEFEPDEPGLLAECCNAVVVSPRSAKRLINVFKLLKIIWQRRGMNGGPPGEVKRAMLMLLSFSARFPEAMRVLLRDLEEEFRGQLPHPNRKLRTFLLERCTKEAAGAIRAWEWMRIKKLIANKAVFPADITLRQIDLDNIRLVNSFSFVGETDPERETAAQRPETPEGIRKQPYNSETGANHYRA